MYIAQGFGIGVSIAHFGIVQPCLGLDSAPLRRPVTGLDDGEINSAVLIISAGAGVIRSAQRKLEKKNSENHLV